MNPLLSIADVVAFTGLSEHSIRRAVKNGDLPATLLCGRYRIEQDDLMLWIDAGRIQPPPPDPEFAGLQAAGPIPDAPAGSYRDLARRRRQRRTAA